MIDNSTYPEQMRHTAPGPRPPSGDASCKKVPPHASPNLASRTQPIEKEALKTS
jgi:hypothetical protein